MLTILVTYDGSPASRCAFGAAAGVARKAGGRLVLLRVWQAPPSLWSEPDSRARDEGLRRLNEEWERDLEAVAAEIRSSGLEVTPVSRRLGERWTVTDEILAVADEVNADLICMATHGESALRHFFLGSTALSVLSRSRRPVMFARVHGSEG